jgi:hypothetical protein
MLCGDILRVACQQSIKAKNRDKLAEMKSQGVKPTRGRPRKGKENAEPEPRAFRDPSSSYKLVKRKPEELIVNSEDEAAEFQAQRPLKSVKSTEPKSSVSTVEFAYSILQGLLAN